MELVHRRWGYGAVLSCCLVNARVCCGGPAAPAAKPATEAAEAAEAAPAAQEAPEAKGDTAVATYEGGAITLAEVQAQIDGRRGAFLSRQLQTNEGRRAYVGSLLNNKILAEEALRRGFDKDPTLQRSMEALLAQDLLRRLRVDRKVEPVTEEEAKEYYESHQADFDRPERKWVRQIFLALSADATEDVRKPVDEKAKSFVEQLKGAGPRASSLFRRLAGEHSPAPGGRGRGGHLEEVRADTKASSRMPQEVLDAAAKLTQRGQISDIVRSAEGLHILYLERATPALKQTFEQARRLIEMRVQASRSSDPRAVARDIFEKAKPTINEETLELLKVPAAPTRATPVRSPRTGRGPRGVPRQPKRLARPAPPPRPPAPTKAPVPAKAAPKPKAAEQPAPPPPPAPAKPPAE